METQEELREKYNPEGSDLRCMQMRMLDVLTEIDKICKKHDIPYWLSDGSLLGCVRHGGFIPWDDDLDIQMLKKDYIRFCSVVNKELPSNLAFQNSDTDEGFFLTFAKVRDLNSRIYELSFFDEYYKYHGVFVDIFPMDECSSFWQKISTWLQWRFLFNPLQHSKGKLKKIKVRQLILNFIYKCFHVSDIVFCVKKIGYPYGSTFTPRYSKETIFPLSFGVFEGKKFPIPGDTDNYLKSLYGDNYMSLPLESEREWHVAKVEFK